MILETLPAVEKLSPQEKLALAGELWDQVTAMPELFPVNPDTVALLEARYSEWKQDPSGAISWEEFRKQFTGGQCKRRSVYPIQLAWMVKTTAG
jgi:putative addiction module component (TIGR02574 family)